MEEQLMFTRIHDALDVPMPPGAYERLRTNLTKKPVRPFRWPALQTRWSMMSFRFAAGLVIVAIAVAAGAAAVAIHNSTNRVSPAGSRMSIQAYQTLIDDDRPDPNTVWAACDNTVHSGCLRSAQTSIPLLQKWLNDISKIDPPARFVVVNTEMRQHLVQNIAVLEALVVDSQARDDAAMSQDYDRALYGVDWTGIVQGAIARSQVVSKQVYAQRVHTEIATIDACGLPCGLDSNVAPCSAGAGISCTDLFNAAAYAFGTFQADLVEYAAPSALQVQDALLQGDLAHADAVLLNLNLAATANDTAAVAARLSELRQVKLQIDQDAAKITG